MRVRLERVRDPGDLAARARQAVSRHDLLVAAGGDGTVKRGYRPEWRSPQVRVLVNLPMGTLDHFAKDARVPSVGP